MFSEKLTVLSLQFSPILHFIRNPSLPTITEEKKKFQDYAANQYNWELKNVWKRALKENVEEEQLTRREKGKSNKQQETKKNGIFTIFPSLWPLLADFGSDWEAVVPA
jgi:hypothetical protein